MVLVYYRIVIMPPKTRQAAKSAVLDDVEMSESNGDGGQGSRALVAFNQATSTQVTPDIEIIPNSQVSPAPVPPSTQLTTDLDAADAHSHLQPLSPIPNIDFKDLFQGLPGETSVELLELHFAQN